MYRLLSHIVTFSVGKISTDRHAGLELVWEKGIKKLMYGQDVCAHGELRTLFINAIKQFNLPFVTYNRVLILGYGAGTIHKVLRKDIKYTKQITGVDLDRELLDVARTHFRIKEMNPVQFQFHQSSAEHYVATTDFSYNAVFLDIYEDHSLAPCLADLDFLNDVLEVIEPHGYLVVNLAKADATSERRIEKFNLNLKTIGATVQDIFRVDALNEIILIKK